MMPHHTYHVAKYRMSDALTRAERARLGKVARTGAPGPYGSGVIDALGHRLIALGTRLVSEPDPPPTHSRAA